MCRLRRSQGGGEDESPAGVPPWVERVLFVACAVSVVSADSWRVAGEDPWASARMRCFIVGGSALSRGRVHRTDGVVAVAAVAPVCSRFVVVGSAAVAWAVAWAVARPSDARSAKKAVMKAVQMLSTLKVLMAPRFQVVRFAYLSDDVDPDGEFLDRRPRCADLLMNTTRMVQPAWTSCFRRWRAVRKMPGRGPGQVPGTVRRLGSREVTDRYRPVCIVGRQKSLTSRKDEVAR